MRLCVQSATGVYLTALPAPGGIQIAGKTPSDLSNEHHVLTIQKRINDTIAKNKEIYQINPPVRQHKSFLLGLVRGDIVIPFFSTGHDTYCKWDVSESFSNFLLLRCFGFMLKLLGSWVQFKNIFFPALNDEILSLLWLLTSELCFCGIDCNCVRWIVAITLVLFQSKIYTLNFYRLWYMGCSLWNLK